MADENNPHVEYVPRRTNGRRGRQQQRDIGTSQFMVRSNFNQGSAFAALSQQRRQQRREEVFQVRNATEEAPEEAGKGKRKRTAKKAFEGEEEEAEAATENDGEKATESEASVPAPAVARMVANGPNKKRKTTATTTTHRRLAPSPGFWGRDSLSKAKKVASITAEIDQPVTRHTISVVDGELMATPTEKPAQKKASSQYTMPPRATTSTPVKIRSSQSTESGSRPQRASTARPRKRVAFAVDFAAESDGSSHGEGEESDDDVVVKKAETGEKGRKKGVATKIKRK